jgi:uncharacterized protein YkwD
VRASAAARVGHRGLVTCALVLLAAAAPADGRAAGERPVACEAGVVPATAGASERPPSAKALRRGVACVLGEARMRRGLAPLRWQPQLAAIARRHARSMVRDSYFSHVGPGGRDLASRVRAGGYRPAWAPWWVGEVLAWGRERGALPATVLARWLASRSHRRVVLNAQACEVGIGVALGVPLAGAQSGPAATIVVELGRRGWSCRHRRSPHRR